MTGLSSLDIACKTQLHSPSGSRILRLTNILVTKLDNSPPIILSPTLNIILCQTYHFATLNWLSFKWTYTTMFPHQNSVPVPYFSSPNHMFKPSHPPKCQSPNNTELRPWKEFPCIHPLHISLKLLCFLLQHKCLNSLPVIQPNC